MKGVFGKRSGEYSSCPLGLFFQVENLLWIFNSKRTRMCGDCWPSKTSTMGRDNIAMHYRTWCW